MTASKPEENIHVQYSLLPPFCFDRRDIKFMRQYLFWELNNVYWKYGRNRN